MRSAALIPQGAQKGWRVLVGLCFLSSLTQLASAANVSLTNAALLTINDSLNPPTTATPYPSSITVTGLTGLAVGKLTVTLRGFCHAYPSDVTALLIGPQGQSSIVMSEVGGQSQFSVTNLTLTLDDDATDALPFSTALVSGTFKPTNGYLRLGDTSLPYELPPPAPPGNSNAVAALSVFKNTDPAGTWNLFVVDDAAGSSGAVSNGWSLNLSLGVPLHLNIGQTNAVLWWTNAVTGCTLQSTTNLNLSWSNVTNAQVVVAGKFMVTNALSRAGTFYRLVK